MTQPDILAILEAAIAERNDARGQGGAARVAEELRCTESLICQLRSGEYKHPARKYRAIVERYGTTADIDCPALREMITPGKCAAIRKRPLAPTNPLSVQLWRACKECKR